MLQTLVDGLYGAGDWAQIVGIWVAALLTLAVLSYVFGENPLFRLMEYLFVGVAAGYAAAIAWNNMLWPRLMQWVQAPWQLWPYALFFVLGLMLLGRGWRPLSMLSNVPLGILFGTGAGLALAGVLAGTLIPQLGASVVSLSPESYGGGISGWAVALDAALLLLGTIAVLAAFQYRRTGPGLLKIWYGGVNALGRVGHLFMTVAFGAILAGSAITFFTVLRSRMSFLIFDWLGSLIDLGL